ncbi:MAG: hypothetical protein HY077_08690 [Elusimicrobia bacterium]|nr:hypothetical protein [Elusimicrobiota bacterium]
MKKILLLVLAVLIFAPASSYASQRIRVSSLPVKHKHKQPKTAHKPLEKKLKVIAGGDMRRNPADIQEKKRGNKGGNGNGGERGKKMGWKERGALEGSVLKNGVFMTPATPAPSMIEPTPVAFMTGGTPSSVESRILAADSILDAAESNSAPYWAMIMHNTHEALLGASIVIPDYDSDFAACTTGTVGFVYMGTSDIYLCNDTVYGPDSSNQNFVAQVLAHESAHVEGYDNECDASAVEMQAMNASGAGLAFRNWYMDQCGL